MLKRALHCVIKSFSVSLSWLSLILHISLINCLITKQTNQMGSKRKLPGWKSVNISVLFQTSEKQQQVCDCAHGSQKTCECAGFSLMMIPVGLVAALRDPPGCTGLPAVGASFQLCSFHRWAACGDEGRVSNRATWAFLNSISGDPSLSLCQQTLRSRSTRWQEAHEDSG